jgi:hypothetical protein
LISHEHKCVFFHQRKCAGTSIINAFGIASPDNPDWHFANDGVLSADYYARPADYFLFSIVRNPWDRFISGWLHNPSTRDVPLRDLLLDLPKLGRDYRHLTRLQRDVLYDHSDHLVVDKLIRFERLQADFDEVCDLVGRPRSTLPRLNQQARRPHQEYFRDPLDRYLFCRHYQRDLDAFEYEF